MAGMMPAAHGETSETIVEIGGQKNMRRPAAFAP